MHFSRILAAGALVLSGASMASAAVIDTNGSLSSRGVAASIIAAPDDVNDDAAFNDAIQAFDEIQGYILLSDLTVDGGVISSGARVDSHMIFLNSGPGQDTSLLEHGFSANSLAATFKFSGAILGVMSQSNGKMETDSSSFLGAPGTLYPGSPFTARGLEGDPLVGFNDDFYSFVGDTITIGMRVTEPGDWVRVVTAATPVPVPAAMPLLLAGLGGLGFMARRKKRKAA